jgi:hypothetical protein
MLCMKLFWDGSFIMSQEMPISGKRGRSAKARTKGVRRRGLVLGALLTGSVAGISGFVAPGAASAASSPVPVAGGKYAGSLILNDAGSKLKSWNKTASYCKTSSPDYIGDGKVATSGSSVTLTTKGEAGSCVGLISPKTYSSVVLEADVYFPPLPSNPRIIANWTGFWLTNVAKWPEAGELDSTEVEPVNAVNAVTWHSGTSSDEFTASTSGFFANELPIKAANIKPGWNTVDVVYTKGFFAVYYNGHLYTEYTNSHVTGSALNVYFTMTDTPATPAVESQIGNAPINSDPLSAMMAVKYLRIWSYKK